MFDDTKPEIPGVPTCSNVSTGSNSSPIVMFVDLCCKAHAVGAPSSKLFF